MTLIKTHWSLSECFKQFRLTKDIHLGGGDIRLSIDIQDSICKISEATTSNEKHSFASSQAIEFNRWSNTEGWHYKEGKGYINVNHKQPKKGFQYISGDDLYSQFLLWQKKQQEGREEA